MKVSLDTGSASYRVRAYGDGYIRINDSVYENDLIMLPETVIADWRSAPVADLDSSHFTAAREQQPEILLLGTGRRQRFPSARLMAELSQAGLGLEVMDTAAACRTFNVLMSEDRIVAAALMMIEPDGTD